MDPFAGDINQQQPQDGMAWWFKWLIKGAAVVLGCLGLIMGVLTTLSISLACMLAGILLIAASVIVLALEVPICCSFIEFIRPITRFSEGRPHYQKVAIYMVPPIIVIILCPSPAAILGSICIFGVAALYFMLTVGKKAPLQEMRTRASESKSNLATSEPTLPR